MTSLSFFNGSTTTTRGFAINVATNRLSGAVAYDTAGNLTSWGGHTYGYDGFNMQTTHDYPDWLQLYTADDERIVSLRYFGGTQPLEETYTLRDLGGKALTSYKAVGGNTGVWYWEKDYVYRDGLLLAAESSEPFPKNVQHYVVDHLGTPRLVTGANGSVVAIHHYFGFGEEIAAGTDPERLRFTGHERDFHEAGTEDDLDYMHARYCSPQLARFMSPDRIAGVRSSPQSWNRYSYVRGNPLKLTDPTGLYFVLAPGLSKSDAKFLKKALVEIARRPAGRALVQKLGGDSRAVILGTGSLNSKEDVVAARRGATADLIFGRNTFRDPRDQSTTVTLDRNSITEFARKSRGTADSGGITTLSHELYHADKALNSTLADWNAGDKPSNPTGPAQQFGEMVFDQDRDSSETDAAVTINGFFESPLASSISILFSGPVYLDGVYVDFSDRSPLR